MSYELGAVLTHWLGISETNFDKLWLLVLITNLSTLLPLTFLGWLPEASEEIEQTAADDPFSSLELPDLVSELVPPRRREVSMEKPID